MLYLYTLGVHEVMGYRGTSVTRGTRRVRVLEVRLGVPLLYHLHPLYKGSTLEICKGYGLPASLTCAYLQFIIGLFKFMIQKVKHFNASGVCMCSLIVFVCVCLMPLPFVRKGTLRHTQRVHSRTSTRMHPLRRPSVPLRIFLMYRRYKRGTLEGSRPREDISKPEICAR